MPVTRRLGERALNFGVPESLYAAAQRVAFDQTLSLAAVARLALAEYVRRHGVKTDERRSRKTAGQR